MAIYWRRNSPATPAESDPALWLLSLIDGSAVRLVEGTWHPLSWSLDGGSVYARDESGVITRFAVSGAEGLVIPPPAIADATCEPHERREGLQSVCSQSHTYSDV